MKCYRSGLERLVQMKPSTKRRGNSLRSWRKRWTAAACCAIKMRSKESNKSWESPPLYQDLWNGPFHCYSNHMQCTADYCTAIQRSSSSPAPSPVSSSSPDLSTVSSGSHVLGSYCGLSTVSNGRGNAQSLNITHLANRRTPVLCKLDGGKQMEMRQQGRIQDFVKGGSI